MLKPWADIVKIRRKLGSANIVDIHEKNISEGDEIYTACKIITNFKEAERLLEKTEKWENGQLSNEKKKKTNTDVSIADTTFSLGERITLFQFKTLWEQGKIHKFPIVGRIYLIIYPLMTKIYYWWWFLSIFCILLCGMMLVKFCLILSFFSYCSFPHFQKYHWHSLTYIHSRIIPRVRHFDVV